MVGALVGSGKVLVLLGAESTGKTRLADLKFEAKPQAPGLLDALLRNR